MMRLYNVLMIKSAEKLRLLPKKRYNIVRLSVLFQNFDSHDLPSRYKFGSINFTKGSLAQIFEKLIQLVNTIINVISMSLCIQIIKYSIENFILNFHQRDFSLVKNRWLLLYKFNFVNLLIFNQIMLIEKFIIFISVETNNVKWFIQLVIFFFIWWDLGSFKRVVWLLFCYFTKKFLFHLH